MKSLRLEDVLQGVHALPSLPIVVMDLLASLDDAELNIPVLVQLIEKDQALTARTLRIANSSFYGMPRQVRSVADAIAMLGFQTIRSITLAAAVISRVPIGFGAAGCDFVAFWRHSIETALTARALAALSGRSTTLAYTAGLLHDVGRLLLTSRYCANYAAVLDHARARGCSLLVAERELLQFDHCTVGDALAQHWKLPAEIRAAIGQHHNDGAWHGDKLPLLVHAADALAHAMQEMCTGDTVEKVEKVVMVELVEKLEPVVCTRLWQLMDLKQGDLERVMRDVLHQRDAAFSMLA